MSRRVNQFFRNGTPAPIDWKNATFCWACGSRMIPWRCGRCEEIAEEEKYEEEVPLVESACQRCHRHGGVGHVGFCGGPPSHWKDDIDANGIWSNLRRAYEEEPTA